MEFLGSHENLPFTIALALMVMLAVVQVGSLLMGSMNFFSSDVDADVSGGVETDASAGVGEADVLVDGHHSWGHAMVSSLLGWLQFGKLPTMVVLVLLLTTFGVGGLLIQKLIQTLRGAPWPALPAVLPAAVFSIVATGILGRWLAPILPKDETEALPADSFLGLRAVIVRGTAARGRPAEAKFQDKHGRTHYVMVEPEREDETFSAGDEVQLILRQGACYRVIAPPLLLTQPKPSPGRELH